jgi:hypothetical protein
MNKRMWWTWVVLVSVALAACSSDDSGDDDAPAAGVGGSAGVAAVGGSTAGAGGSSGAGGTGGAGGTMAAMPIPCGTATCQPVGGGFMLPGLPLPRACCADEAMGTCGTMPASGGTCMPPLPADPRCPMATSSLPIPLISCCTATNMCGLDGSALGMGCVDFATVAGGPLGMLLMIPAPVTCDGMPVGGDEDAGI